MTDDLDLEAMDSGDAAAMGMAAGAAAGWVLSDGQWQVAALGAGVGLVASGESFDRVLGAPVDAEEVSE